MRGDTYGRETYIGEVPMMLDFRSNLALITITEENEYTRTYPAISTGLIGIIGYIDLSGTVSIHDVDLGITIPI